ASDNGSCDTAASLAGRLKVLFTCQIAGGRRTAGEVSLSVALPQVVPLRNRGLTSLDRCNSSYILCDAFHTKPPVSSPARRLRLFRRDGAGLGSTRRSAKSGKRGPAA